MHPVLKQVCDWLLGASGIQTDHGGDGNNYLGFELYRDNRYDNILLSVNDDSLLSCYVEPFIECEEIDASPHGKFLND